MVPPGCVLSGGTVPPECVLSGGTVPPGCVLSSGTVPPGCVLSGGKVPPFNLSLLYTRVSIAIDINNFQLLKNHITGLDNVGAIARLATLGLHHAGDWLNFAPSPALGLHLLPPEFITSVKYRLGMNIFLMDGPCTACSQPAPSLVTPRGTMRTACGIMWRPRRAD